MRTPRGGLSILIAGAALAACGGMQARFRQPGAARRTTAGRTAAARFPLTANPREPS